MYNDVNKRKVKRWESIEGSYAGNLNFEFDFSLTTISILSEAVLKLYTRHCAVPGRSQNPLPTQTPTPNPNLFFFKWKLILKQRKMNFLLGVSWLSPGGCNHRGYNSGLSFRFQSTAIWTQTRHLLNDKVAVSIRRRWRRYRQK